MSKRKTSDGRTLTAPQVAALEAIEGRLRWPSLHWGVESVDADAWPHLASAAADAALAAQLAISVEQVESAWEEWSHFNWTDEIDMDLFRAAFMAGARAAGLTVAGESQ